MQYKVVIYKEGIFSSLLFGSGKVNPEKFTDFLNEQTIGNWQVITMEKDIRRLFLFWKRESFVVILGKEKNQNDLFNLN